MKKSKAAFIKDRTKNSLDKINLRIYLSNLER